MVINDIIERYRLGRKIIEIAREERVRHSTISKILKDNNVQIRTAKHVDFLPYSLNHHYFDLIDSQSKAYLLGYMYADGCVSAVNNTISLVSKDLYPVSFFREEIHCQKPLYQNPLHNGAYTFSFCSPLMKATLIKLGCPPRKSLILDFPDKNVPEKLLPHFLRGEFDGDGCITKSGHYLQAYFLGALPFCKGLMAYLSSIGISTNTLQKNGKIYRVRLCSRKEIEKLFNLMYHEASCFLERKFNIFKSSI